MKKRIQELKEGFLRDAAEVRDSKAADALRIRYLGRSGLLADLFSLLGSLPTAEKKDAGRELNELKKQFQESVDALQARFRSAADAACSFDYTLPGDPMWIGHKHPLQIVMSEIQACFKNMGFSVAQGPEMETEYYNFEALNIPRGHPARDMQDTFFIDEEKEIVLRTHTSPVQVHVMENQQPPVRIIAPGRCYRNDTPDATHSPVFHQVEGLCVDEGVAFSDLKGVILAFARSMFGSDMKIRFRPSFFPFTEPSAEYDFSCLICRGKGCRVCGGSGWVEISGAGMVNPEVFKYVNYDAERYTGYAFGMGVERIAMLLYEVPDIRMFFENDIRFLKQF
ncbi:phenylalanine--tRNA ligase subunit alpha [bacterium]|nr:phenylalanine--tRNA ligase subunit alpha [bacterium]